MRARTVSTLALALSLLALAAWRAACVLAGPDIDTDAYAHHMIARAILADPRDLAVHWVWLPLFHYAQVPIVWLGGTMDDVRWTSVALAAAVPVVLYAYVQRTARSGRARVPPEATALLAALFAGACPIAMQMGTTAQPEPLFALLVLAVAVAFERGRHGWAAATLGAAVMLRYEAWAALCAIAALLVLEATARPRLRRGVVNTWSARPRLRGLGATESAARAWVVVAVPLALIVAWAALRRPVDGRWFGFLRDTHEFASDALQDRGGLARGVARAARDVLFYPVHVAIRVLGPVAVLAPLGFMRTVRQQGLRFVGIFVACLGFVSLSWVTRSSLGLDRHFVVVVPLYATCAAQGISAAADWAARALDRVVGRDRTSIVGGRGLAAGLALASLLGLGVELVVWMGFWRASIARGWPERASLGQYLRSLPGSQVIHCDDATLEILSGLDRRRFDRHWVDDPHTWDLVQDDARERGTAYVATWRRKLRGRERAGEIVFLAGSDPADPDGTGVAVMRVTAEAGRARR